MKSFQSLIEETIEAADLEELESAADLFQFGVERGYYNKRQVDEFNNTYWSIKDKYLAEEVLKTVKGNNLDIISIVSRAPTDIKNENSKLVSYVTQRLQALKGKNSFRFDK